MEKRLIYDREGDMLQLWLKDPEEIESIISQETGEDILVKKNEDTGETIGVTVLNFKARREIQDSFAKVSAEAL